MVASADQAATQAGMAAIARGGNAVDAAIAANAALAVTAPHLCGLGGDLFALVHTGHSVVGLNASGRAGSGADPDRLRAEGHAVMPFRHDIRSVTVPGCVDGWVMLHERFGALPLAEVLDPAVRLAEGGFAASPLLVGSLSMVDDMARANLDDLAHQAVRTGTRVRRLGVGRVLRSIASSGRHGFYGGEFGDGLLRLAGEEITEADLDRRQADWVEPLGTDALGLELHTMPPNSQGYLTLGASRLASNLDLPDPDDPRWVHLLVEAATAAGHDRPDALHEGADGAALLAAIDQRMAMVDRTVASGRDAPAHPGDTTYLCTADDQGMAVSLIQSNASGFGSWLVEPTTGINLHNRGLGFSLIAGHPAEYGPGRRPPHTLSPALATRRGTLAAVFGTMGGDAQPQILLQVAVRLFLHGQSPARAIGAARWALRGENTGFDTWTSAGGRYVVLEGHAPTTWHDEVASFGHRTRRAAAYDSEFGHAHAIVTDGSGVFVGAADPRSVVGSVAAV
jgi:gamma-glutamyltranspeptidase / glutathione hydrolase